MGHARLHQSAAQLAGAGGEGPVREEAPREQGGEGADPVPAQRDQPSRVAADEDTALLEPAHRPVQFDPEPVGQRGHNERPPSTGITAPVSPLLSGPASHASAAATSSGASRRLIGCWSANAAEASSP